MAKKDLSYKYDTCKCGERKLKRSLVCLGCSCAERKGKQCSGKGAVAVASTDGCCVVCATRLKPSQKAFCCLPCRLQHLRVPERQCVGCGVTFKPKGSKPKYCTNECANRHKAVVYRRADSKMQAKKKNQFDRRRCCRVVYRNCIECGEFLCTRPGKQKYCNAKCARKRVHQKRVATGKYVHQSGEFTCYCGRTVSVKSHFKMRTACSKRCLRTEMKAARRAKIKTRRVDRGVNWRAAVRRFGWECSACKCVCKSSTSANRMNEATLDHVVPLAKGGTHTWDNVQVLCRACNIRKSDNENFLYDSAALTK